MHNFSPNYVHYLLLTSKMYDIKVGNKNSAVHTFIFNQFIVLCQRNGIECVNEHTMPRFHTLH